MVIPSDPEPSPEQVEARRLADELRRIIARLVLVRPPADDLAAAADAAARFAERLEELPARSVSWEVNEAGLAPRDFVEHSPLSGLSNPLAPPMSMRVVDDDSIEAGYAIEGEVTFGAAYEGPPGHAHGGYVSAMFDELLGFAQLSGGFTGTLKIIFRRPTPLNQKVALRAWIDRVEGRKRFALGTAYVGDTLLTEAEGIFIAPREGYLEQVLGKGATLG